MATKTKTTKTFYSLKDAATRIGVSVGSLKRACWAGVLAGADKVGGAWQVPAATVARIAEMGKSNALVALAQARATKSAIAAPAKTPPAKKTAKAKSTSKGNQHVVLVMDDSASMGHIRDRANTEGAKMLNAMVNDLRGAGFDVQVSGYEFATGVARRAKRIQSWKPSIGATGGATALNSAIIRAIEDSEKEERSDESTLILVVTDGENNRHGHSVMDVRDAVRRAQGTGRYTVLLAGPSTIKSYASAIGIEAGNVAVWDQSNEGVAKLCSATVAGGASYTQARAGGQRAVNNYFRPDLSKLTAADLAKLADLSAHFKAMKVDKESRVDEFILDKTKEPLVIGSVYYQLMKREKVQSHKGVLVRRIGEKRIYGGAQARRLLGLPKHEVTVEPGNHAGYEIFVQSTSINRKLPRGTSILWDKTQKTAMTPTWDHTAL